MNQFLRIANARLKKVYPNKIQRRAWVAKMWARYCERNSQIANPHNKKP